LKKQLERLALPKYPAPFFRPVLTPNADTWVSSCRKIDTKGKDAFLGMAKRLQNENMQSWPALLMLCGDQIYADEISDETMKWLDTLHQQFFGVRKNSGDRTAIIKKLGFSCDTPRNHLLTLSEWVCLYLLNWSTSLCTSISIKKETLLEVSAAETVMAHVPTYMIFDDHEVTDDWNIDTEWRANIKKKGGGTVIEAALIAYFIFQHWGNSPESIDKQFLKKLQVAVDTKLGKDEKPVGIFDNFLWSYIIEGSPPSLVLDCRTKRAVDNDVVWLDRLEIGEVYLPCFARDQTVLCSPEELQRAKRLIGENTDKLILYINTPFFGYPIQETVQAISSRFFSRQLDPESWDAYPRSWTLLCQHLLRPLNVKSLIIISGDVHYSYAAEGTLSFDNWSCRCFEIVSSPSKNSGAILPNALMLTTPFPGPWLRATWLKGFRYLSSTGALPDVLQYRLLFQAITKVLNAEPYLKTWKLKTASLYSNRPTEDNSFATFRLDGLNIHYSSISSESSELTKINSSLI